MNICNEEGIRFKTCTLVSRGTVGIKGCEVKGLKDYMEERV